MKNCKVKMEEIKIAGNTLVKSQLISILLLVSEDVKTHSDKRFLDISLSHFAYYTHIGWAERLHRAHWFLCPSDQAL